MSTSRLEHLVIRRHRFWSSRGAGAPKLTRASFDPGLAFTSPISISMG
jgi:hypothetical protein